MNVHGIYDAQPTSADNFNRSGRRQRQQQQNGGILGGNDGESWVSTIQNLKAVQQHKVLFLSGNQKIKNPRDEHYCDMLKVTWCPTVKPFSITLLILIAQLAMFITSVAMGIDKKQQLLQIQSDVLYKLGANYSPSIKSGEVYRLVAAEFLHVHFLHLVGNFITTLIFVSRVEYSFGWFKTILVYLISGIGGNIFSDLTKPSDSIIKVGASTSLFGIIGVILAYVIINWRGLDVIGRMLKCQMMFITVVVILFILILTPYNSNIDYMGHLGGFITGFLMIGIHQTIRNDTCQKVLRIVSLTLFVLVMALWFLLFYLT